MAELFHIVGFDDEDSFLRKLRRDKILPKNEVTDIILSCLNENADERLDCEDMLKLLFNK